jgi:hypothetical protein
MSETKTVSIQSDVGSVVLYDPAMLSQRVKASASWWRTQPLALSERAEGRFALWPLGEGRAANRTYRWRLGSALTDAEKPFDRGSSEPVLLRVEGEELFLGPIERLPGDGAGDRLPTLPDGGDIYPGEPGAYSVIVHVLDWRPEDRFWSEDNEPTADAPVDFVVLLEKSDAEAPGVPEPKPLLEYLPKKKRLASKTVVKHTRPAHKSEEEKKAAKRARKTTTKKKVARGIRQPVQVRALKAGELGVGASVRHTVYGVGEVLFMRDGFPKVKVRFSNRDLKVDKSEITVV